MTIRTSARLLALAASGVALSSPSLAAESTPSSGTSAGSEEGALEQVVVTAQRRSQNLESVPLVVTAISPQMVENFEINDMMALPTITPGLTMSNWVGFAQTYIRGIGANFSNAGVENPIGVFVDGAYIQRSKGGNLEILDVESVQVLKGPQATLWGRNVTGGAILINTADPEFDSSGHVGAEVGTQGHRSYEAVLNKQVSDTIAVRFAGRYNEADGYYTDIVNGYEYGWARNTQLRGKVRFEPNDNFSAVFQYEHLDRTESQAPNPQMLPDVLCSTCAALPYRHPLPEYNTAITFVNDGVGSEAKNNFFNLKMQFDTDKLTFTSVSAYTDNSTDDTIDADLTEANVLEFISPSTNETFTQTLTGSTTLGGWIESTFGVDFLTDKSTYALYPVVRKSHIDTTSISPFAEVTVKPIGELSVTAGARYTDDERDARQEGTGAEVHFADTNVSPRLVIAYDFGAVNLYASYNRGHKAGGIQSPAEPPGVFESETLSSIEVGLKYLSPGRTLRVNLAAFDYDYEDLQGLAINQGGSGGPSTVQQPSAKLQGVEFDATWEVTSHLELFTGGLYEDSEYRNFDNAGVQVVTFDSNGNPTGMTTGVESLTGRSLPHAPSLSGFLGANISGALMAGWTGNLNAVVSYSDSYDFFPGAGGPLRYDRTDSYTNARLSGSIVPDNERYEIGFFVDNLTDEKNIEFRFTTAPFGATEILSRPRTYGLRLKARF